MQCQQQSCGDLRNYICRFHEILSCMIEGMTSAPLTDSISHNFIVQMIPHHRAAIQMSENVLQYTSLEPLKEIAENIITEQTKGIEDMENALCACEELSSSRGDIRSYQRCFKQITREMFRGMRTARVTDNISANFMREMIPHHKGAIRMSENALRFQICPELEPILKAIIASQERGVCEMEQLLREICK